MFDKISCIIFKILCQQLRYRLSIIIEYLGLIIYPKTSSQCKRPKQKSGSNHVSFFLHRFSSFIIMLLLKIILTNRSKQIFFHFLSFISQSLMIAHEKNYDKSYQISVSVCHIKNWFSFFTSQEIIIFRITYQQGWLNYQSSVRQRHDAIICKTTEKTQPQMHRMHLSTFKLTAPLTVTFFAFCHRYKCYDNNNRQ